MLMLVALLINGGCRFLTGSTITSAITSRTFLLKTEAWFRLLPKVAETHTLKGIRAMKWQDKLNKTELRHLRVMGVTTLKGAKRNAAHQARLRKFDPAPSSEPCWECRKINEKLGL